MSSNKKNPLKEIGILWEYTPEFNESAPLKQSWYEIEDMFEVGTYDQEKPLLINIVKPDNSIVCIKIHHIEKTSRQAFCTVMMNNQKIMFEY